MFFALQSAAFYATMNKAGADARRFSTQTIEPKGRNNMKDTKIPTLCEKGAVSQLKGSSFCYQGWPTVCRDEEGTLYAAASSFRCAHVCPFGKNAMFISKNGGKTWSPPIVVNDTYLDDRDAGLLYMGEGRLLLSHFHHPATYYETNKDSLLTWAGSDEIKKGFAGVIDGLACLPEEQRKGGSFVRLSEDYGMTWSENIRVPVTAPHGPCLCPDGSLLYLGKGSFSREEDGIDKDEIWAYASLDGGKTWEKRGLCQKPADISWRVLHEPHALALPDGSLLGAIRSEAGSTGGGCFATFITKSYDGGRTWNSGCGAACGLPGSADGSYAGVWVDPDDKRKAFAVNGGSRYTTNDGGASWHGEEIGQSGEFAVDPTDPARFYVKSAAGVFATTDWKRFRFLGLAGESEGAIACDALGRVLVCRGRTGDPAGRGLWRLDPRGGGWVRLHDDALSCAVASDPSDPTRIILTTSDNPYHDFAGARGVYASSDDGKTWRPANEGLHIRRLTCVAFDPFDGETLVAGTLGGGFVTARWERSRR